MSEQQDGAARPETRTPEQVRSNVAKSDVEKRAVGEGDRSPSDVTHNSPEGEERAAAIVAAVDYKIVVGSEPLISIRNQLPRFVQKLVGGNRIHNSTAYRWALKGVRGRRLPSVRVGGRLFTTAGAFSWWSQELAQDLIGVVDAVGEDEGEEEAGNNDVMEILRRAGIKT